MKKKKYRPPEIEVTIFRLAENILLSSIEHKPISDAGGNMDDPIDDNPLDWGGF